MGSITTFFCSPLIECSSQRRLYWNVPNPTLRLLGVLSFDSDLLVASNSSIKGTTCSFRATARNEGHVRQPECWLSQETWEISMKERPAMRYHDRPGEIEHAINESGIRILSKQCRR